MSSNYMDSLDQIPPEDFAEAMARLEARHGEIVSVCQTRRHHLKIRRLTAVFGGIAAMLSLFAGVHFAQKMLAPSPMAPQIVVAPDVAPTPAGDSADSDTEILLPNGPISKAVPEPATALLCAAGSLMFLRRRR